MHTIDNLALKVLGKMLLEALLLGCFIQFAHDIERFHLGSFHTAHLVESTG